MLLNFRFSNYKSFYDLNHFSMIASKVRKNEQNYINLKDEIKEKKLNKNLKILKFAELYGLNAGGKSNFVDAISFSQTYIKEGIDELRTIQKYNKNEVDAENTPTNFEYELLIDGKIFSYGFSISLTKREIISEYLYEINGDNQEIPIFIRNAENISKINHEYLELNEKEKLKLEIYLEDISKDELFLTRVNTEIKNNIKNIRSEISILNKIYFWFSNVLEVITPNNPSRSFTFYYLQSEHLEKLQKYLEGFDTGIKNIIFEEVKDDVVDLPSKVKEKLFERLLMKSNSPEIKKSGVIIRTKNNLYKIEVDFDKIRIYEIRFVHHSSLVSYSIGEESDGTQRLVEIISILLDNSQKVYVIDEIDRSLHPKLTYNFVEKYISEINNQLIITTHEDYLLDLNLVRRDQIWFVERNNKSNSVLYSLEEYKERFDKDISKEYLNGRYGAIPNIDFI